ncbi:histidine kinase [Bacteroidota bacterium]
MDEVNILIDNYNVDSVDIPEIRKIYNNYLELNTKEALIWANDLIFKIKNEELLIRPELLFEIAQELDIRNHLLIADELYITAKEIYTKSGDFESALTQDIHIAYNKSKKGDYKSALAILENVLKEAEDKGYYRQIAEAYMGLGYANVYLEKYETAIDYSKKALEYSIKINDQLYIAQTYYIIGKISSLIGNERIALVNYRNSIEYDDSTLLRIIYIEMSNSYNKINLTDSSFFYARKAINISSKTNDYKHLPDSYGFLGRLLFEHGNYEEGKLYIDSCISIAIENRDFVILAGINKYLSNYFSQKADHKQALNYFQLYSDYSDSVRIETTNNQLFVQQALSRSIKQQNELNLLEKENKDKESKINKTRLALLGTAVLLILTFLFIYSYRLRSSNKMAELKQQLTRFQMNPHFIFNSLNSLQNFILENDIRSTNKYLSMFSTLMRGTLENSYHNIVSINEELKHLELYLHLESLRFDHKFEYKIDIDPEIDINHFKIPSLIIQPFVENAIWHGLLNKKNGERTLIIKIHLSDKQIICEVEDNGVGRQKAMEIISGKVKEHKSLGTKITDQRLKLLSAIHKRKFSVNYKDLIDVNGKPSGTRVDIILPLVI